jgi:hypothetical protein
MFFLAKKRNGRTCFRLVHDDQQFSENLDFDNFTTTTEKFEQVAAVIARC